MFQDLGNVAKLTKLHRLSNYFTKTIINKNLFWYRKWKILFWYREYNYQAGKGFSGWGKWKEQMFALSEASHIMSKQHNLLVEMNGQYRNIYS